MATMLLSVAGASLGAAVGGGIGAVAGRALGAVAGSLIDQAVLGAGARAVETAPPSALRIATAREGAAIPRVFGRMRVAGAAIWATRFRFETDSRSAGGKGAAPSAAARDRRYTVSFALALCEGPIDRIGRLWADGRLIDPESVMLRLHRGTEDQSPDPLIEAIEGAGEAPAYRGVAYVVFEDLDLSPFGGRIPQINVEVFRQPRPDRALHPYLAPPLGELVRGVALSPGSGEFVLETEPVRRRLGPGRAVSENVHTVSGRADLLEALDQLEAEAPACRSVSLVVSWFGDDLRCGRCRIRPGVEEREKTTEPVSWSVSGLARGDAALVGRTTEGRPVFGGTPSDRGVIAAIRELRRRGLRVMFYPFLLMDIGPENALPDPYGGLRQAAYPWRGRITLDRAPGLSGSADGGAGAAGEVAAFFGAARPEDFSAEGESVAYRGAEEWSWRRFVLHYARLCEAAGGVDAFCVGSELRGLTTIRDSRTGYPAVSALAALAQDVRSILGPATKLGYAADWSEYFGHHPDDGSGDVLFHLDPLWADPAIDFVGIDNYMPISDWREGDDHLDAAEARSADDLGYLRSRMEGGEGYHWFYASDADRLAQRRTPIADGAHGEDWIFRFKDLRGWWENRHHDRVGGVRAAASTAWAPRSKPIRFTEIGCGAVDLGANQPNVFVDPKSSESALPRFSAGRRDPFMQRRFLQAALGYWADPAVNPVSPVYGGPMVETDAIHVWTWDARPWPAFPERSDAWGDGDNHALGHWLQGRMASAGLQETVAEICAACGAPEADVSDLRGVVDGYAIEEVGSGRQALQPLMLAYGFDAVEGGDRLRFVMRGGRSSMRIDAESIVAGAGESPDGVGFSRAAATEAAAAVRLSYPASDRGYDLAAAEAQPAGLPAGRIEVAATTVAMEADQAAATAARWCAEATAARASASFSLPPSRIALEPGDAVEIPSAGGFVRHRIDRIEAAGALAVTATREATPAVQSRPPAGRRRPRAQAVAAPQPMAVAVLDLAADGRDGPLVAAFCDPWPGEAAIWRSDDGARYVLAGRATRPATMGALAAPLAAAAPHRWSTGTAIEVDLYGGLLVSAPRLGVLNGANRAAIESPCGGWEIVQFAEARLVGPGRWRLAGLLRGQGGTERLIGDPTPAGARFVALDGAPAPVSWSAFDRGLIRRWRIGPAHRPHGDPSFVEVEAALSGAWLRPPPPARLTATQRADGGLALAWVRRSRADADAWADGAGFDRGGGAVWRLRVLKGTEVIRAVETTDAAYAYGAAERAADGCAAPFDVAVCELPADGAPGLEARITVHG